MTVSDKWAVKEANGSAAIHAAPVAAIAGGGRAAVVAAAAATVVAVTLSSCGLSSEKSSERPSGPRAGAPTTGAAGRFRGGSAVGTPWMSSVGPAVPTTYGRSDPPFAGAAAGPVSGTLTGTGSGGSGAGSGTGSGAGAIPAPATVGPAPTTHRAAAPGAPRARRRGLPPAAPVALKTVPTVVTASQKPVPVSWTGTFGGGITVSISKVAPVVSDGVGPGEIAGAPAVALTFRLRNASGAAIGLNGIAVTATYGGAATPASPVTDVHEAPLHGSLGNGQSASGTYVFQIPTSRRGQVTVTVSYTANRPTVVFVGSLA